MRYWKDPKQNTSAPSQLTLPPDIDGMARGDEGFLPEGGVAWVDKQGEDSDKGLETMTTATTKRTRVVEACLPTCAAEFAEVKLGTNLFELKA